MVFKHLVAEDLVELLDELIEVCSLEQLQGRPVHLDDADAARAVPDAIAIGEQVLPKVGDALSPPVLEERLDSRKVFQPQRDRREVEHLRVVAEFAPQPVYGVLIDLKGLAWGIRRSCWVRAGRRMAAFG